MVVVVVVVRPSSSTRARAPLLALRPRASSRTRYYRAPDQILRSEGDDDACARARALTQTQPPPLAARRRLDAKNDDNNR
jgi:hypothetical protein